MILYIRRRKKKKITGPKLTLKRFKPLFPEGPNLVRDLSAKSFFARLEKTKE